MTRFIFFCMAIIALSFIAVPIFTGISKERKAMLNSEQANAEQTDTLDFDEIYELTNAEPSAEDLNQIMPAAGGTAQDEFSSGFSGTVDSALADTAPAPVTETQTTDTQN